MKLFLIALAVAHSWAAGRDRRPVFFTVIPDYEGHQRQRNRDWKPTFEKRWGLAGTRVLVRLVKAKGCLVTGQSVWHSNCVVSKAGYPTPRQSSD